MNILKYLMKSWRLIKRHHTNSYDQAISVFVTGKIANGEDYEQNIRQPVLQEIVSLQLVWLIDLQYCNGNI